jgi:hypothetical protein
VPRDLSVADHSVWAIGDQLDMRVNGKASKGIDQLETFYYYGPLVQTGEGHVSVFNLQRLRTVKDRPYPVYGDTTSTGSSINVKGGDSYVGGVYCDLPDRKLEDPLKGLPSEDYHCVNGEVFEVQHIVGHGHEAV